LIIFPRAPTRTIAATNRDFPARTFTKSGPCHHLNREFVIPSSEYPRSFTPTRSAPPSHSKTEAAAEQHGVVHLDRDQASTIQTSNDNMQLIFECSAGYALFKAKDKKLLKSDTLAEDFSTVEGTVNALKLKKFLVCTSAPPCSTSFADHV
jgi:hypothetical protein